MMVESRFASSTTSIAEVAVGAVCVLSTEKCLKKIQHHVGYCEPRDVALIVIVESRSVANAVTIS